MATDIEELKEVVAQTLDAKGVLGKIKANLRASVFTAIDEQQRKSGVYLESNVGRRIQELAEGKLALGLVCDFLEFYELDYTLSVLYPEAGLSDTTPPLASDAISSSLKLSKSNKYPLLVDLLFSFQHGATTPRAPFPSTLLDIASRVTERETFVRDPNIHSPRELRDSSNHSPRSLAAIPKQKSPPTIAYAATPAPTPAPAAVSASALSLSSLGTSNKNDTSSSSSSLSGKPVAAQGLHNSGSAPKAAGGGASSLSSLSALPSFSSKASAPAKPAASAVTHSSDEDIEEAFEENLFSDSDDSIDATKHKTQAPASAAAKSAATGVLSALQINKAPLSSPSEFDEDEFTDEDEDEDGAISKPARSSTAAPPPTPAAPLSSLSSLGLKPAASGTAPAQPAPLGSLKGPLPSLGRPAALSKLQPLAKAASALAPVAAPSAAPKSGMLGSLSTQLGGLNTTADTSTSLSIETSTFEEDDLSYDDDEETRQDIARLKIINAKLDQYGTGTGASSTITSSTITSTSISTSIKPSTPSLLASKIPEKHNIKDEEDEFEYDDDGIDEDIIVGGSDGEHSRGYDDEDRVYGSDDDLYTNDQSLSERDHDAYDHEEDIDDF